MQRITRSLLATLTAALVTGAVAADTAPRPASGLTVVPATVHCPAVADRPIERDVWLVNRATHTIRLRGAAPTCGCTSVDDLTDVTLAPGHAHRVRVRVKPSERTAKRKPVRVRFDTEWGAPAICNVEFDGAPADRADVAATPDGVLMLTERGPLGAVAAGAPYETAVWLVNDGPEAQPVERIKAGCGCTAVIGFAPTVLAPGAAVRVRLVVTPSDRKIGAKEVEVTALDAGGGQLGRTRLAMHVTAPADAAVAATAGTD